MAIHQPDIRSRGWYRITTPFEIVSHHQTTDPADLNESRVRNHGYSLDLRRGRHSTRLTFQVLLAGTACVHSSPARPVNNHLLRDSEVDPSRALLSHLG